MISQDKRMERILVLASLVSLSMGQGLLTITQHPRDTHVAPGGTVRSLNRLKYFRDLAPVPSKLPNKMMSVIANLIFAVYCRIYIVDISDENIAPQCATPN